MAKHADDYGPWMADEAKAMTADQLMPCLGCDDLRCNDCFESKCRELGYTRPTAVASHAEGEVVAGLWIGKSEDGEPGYGFSSRPALQKLAWGNYELYTHPHRRSDEADAARYRWLRDDQTGAVEEAILIDRYGDVEVKLGQVLDQAIDNAMAARGGDK